MAIVKQEEIVGYRIGEELVHADCIEDSEREEITLDGIITESERDRDDDLLFCDRCKNNSKP